jgi:signal transduction histidine kinase
MSAASLHDTLSAITHDLRQPLHAVLLYLDALDRRTEREDARDILSKARAAASALSDQLSALTLHNRLNRQEVEPYFEAVDVRDVAASVSKAASAQANIVDPPASIHDVETDAALLVQILTALIANALAHGGGAANLEFEQSGDDIAFRVSDQGAGIPLKDRGRVFDPFVKLQSGGDGLGLGLTNGAQLAALLGARIDIEDAPSGGACVSLYCPRRASAR